MPLGVGPRIAGSPVTDSNRRPLLTIQL
jgi:hypothetical protein